MTHLLRATIVAHGLANAWLGWRSMDDSIAGALGDHSWAVMGALFVVYLIPTILGVVIVTFLSRFTFRLVDRQAWMPRQVTTLLTPVLTTGLAAHVAVAFLRQSGAGPESGLIFLVPAAVLCLSLARSGRFRTLPGLVAALPSLVWLGADAAMVSFGYVG